jgi:hypothetical protein
MGYKKNSENSSNPKSVLTFGVKGHDNHVHVSNISKELSKSGGSSKSSESGGSSFAKMIGKSLLNAVGITEEKLYSSFGDDTQTRYGSIIIPKDNNSKIKSPVEGKITSLRNSNCQNQIVILFDNDGERGYLEYCGISNPLVKYGEKVNIGTLLGKTDTDVNVTLYDSKNNRVSINTKKEKTKKTPVDIDISDLSNKNEYSKLLIKTYRKLKKPFENVKDKEGNVVQKRWSSPTEKEQPVDWINRLSPTYNKKLKEDINRIKGLLK